MRPFSTSRGGRRGNVTVVVVAFLALFLILGLTFAFYSIAEADQAKVFRDSANAAGAAGPDGAPPNPEMVFNQALRDIIFPAPDDITGAFNALRGHDMARLAYGYNLFDKAGNTQPFNGVGWVPPHTVHPILAANAPAPVPYSDRIVNWTWMQSTLGQLDPRLQAMYDPDNNFIRDPRNPIPPIAPLTYRYYAKNANYSYPDENNLFLAAIDPKSGRVLLPSYHRPWLVTDLASGAPMPPPDPANPADLAVTNVTPPEAASGVTQKMQYPSHNPANVANPNPWTNAYGRLRMLRPRPVDNMVQVGPNQWQSFFPYPKMNIGPNGLPDGTYGDVQNLEGKAYGQQFDSLWADLDLPVRRFNGKNYKPLVALLIVDQDSRINLNTAGNFFPLPDDPPPGTSMQPQDPSLRAVMPPQYGHGSNQGFGRWEINPAWVMPTPIPPQAQAILAGLPPTSPDVANRVYWFQNEAAYLSRWPLAWKGPADPPPPPSWKMVPPSSAVRYGGVNAFGQMGVPDRRFRAFPNENIGLNQPSPGSGTHFYGQVDYDGTSAVAAAPKYGDGADGQATNLIFGPPWQFQAGPPPKSRPDPNSRYWNGVYDPPIDERTSHPSMYNPYWVKSFESNNPLTAPDRVFGVEEIRFLSEKYNYGDYSSSKLAALAPTTLGNGWYLSSPPLPMAQLNSRFAVTTLSNDINLPGASPWLGAPSNYQLVTPVPQKPWLTYAAGTPMPFAPSPGNQPAAAGADYDPYYRATLAALGPVDLNRKLTDYRATVSQPYSTMNMGNVQRATQDRQEMAKDIFQRLMLATTGNADPSKGDPNGNRWLAQLAVNIVDYTDNDDIITPFNWNPAFADPSIPDNQKNGWVYGFERPRLVMNETYIRYENDPTEPDPPIDPTTTFPKPSPGKFYSLRIWIELHNPLTPAGPGESMSPGGDDGTNGGYRARLTETFSTGERSVYRISIRKVQIPVAAQDVPDPMKMRAPDNVLGTPAGTTGGSPPPDQIVEFAGPNVTNPPAGQPKVVDPNSDPAQRFGPNKSFYLIGPEADSDQMTANQAAELPPAMSGIKADLTTKDLQFALMDMVDVDATSRPKWAPGFALQRLANPYVDPNPATNPYVTIDYLDPDPTGTSVYDHVKGTYDGMRQMQPDLNTTFAWGRRQPYDGRVKFDDQQHYRQGNGMAAPGQIGGHTFKKHNAKNGNWPSAAGPGTSTDESPGTLTDDTLQFPFLPLNHLDRVILTTGELLNVVAVKPHELTHSFFMTTAAPATQRRLAYTANWLDQVDGVLQPGQSTFLFRALDFLRPSAMIEGVPAGGRVPGRVNPNTLFANTMIPQAPEHLLAVTDPPIGQYAANRFGVQDVNRAWVSLMDPATGGRQTTPGQITKDDRPFLGTAIPVMASANPPPPPGQTSQNQTLLKPGTWWDGQAQNGLEDFKLDGSPGAPGAAAKYELLSKAYGHLTTRSNTFAVWMTIGYFEVLNDGPYTFSNRPILGKELGTDDGTSVRHKFFAVIDRTNLAVDPQPTGVVAQGPAPVFLTYQPNVPLPDATNGGAVIPDPNLAVGIATPQQGMYPPAPPAPPHPYDGVGVEVRIPAVSSVNVGGTTLSISGYYDGQLWTLTDGRPLPGGQPTDVPVVEIGIGAQKELAVVQFPPDDPANPDPDKRLTFNPATGTARVILRTINPMFMPGAPALPALPNPQWQQMFLFNHHRGAAIRVLNRTLTNLFDPATATVPLPRPGNPGPQAAFQHNAPRYTSVVKYAEQVR